MRYCNIVEAADSLVKGGVVAFPTETVYGLGADADNYQAISKVYSIKNRPLNHPVIVHLLDGADILYWAESIPIEAYLLIENFWPGPLTILLKKSKNIIDLVSGGQNTIGLRCPSHSVAQELLREFVSLKPFKCGGLIAPSANKFGKVSPTNASHVSDEFSSDVCSDIMILDGGKSMIGIESTIIDLSCIVNKGSQPALLRPGFIKASQIEEILGRKVSFPTDHSPVVPGSLKAHYSTNTPLEIIKKDIDLIDLNLLNKKIAILSCDSPPITLPSNFIWFNMSDDHVLYASKLYSKLREIDTSNFDRIFVYNLPDSSEWDAIKDRLYRAAAAFI
ncbi:putative translation factor [Candidatus Kinetoplastibacterium oncopeltii TCC290E]|uniref:Threonylcarbamoyl-AMP synthase n=1 Tax=Candidatus Kinetoplastidibacterium stringomonadis TCC290E TaxID=1208920 RepID=M1LRG8_9PROT|nr:L-threonylcarbamoyladenylate synthase [Candidatus Kinetoplastibacterium oncopeltii]AGF48157.1 putative translation factor [Candidatus Kinetoplastibacterium oncopeltii TCC290E]